MRVMLSKGMCDTCPLFGQLFCFHSLLCRYYPTGSNQNMTPVVYRTWNYLRFLFTLFRYRFLVLVGPSGGIFSKYLLRVLLSTSEGSWAHPIGLCGIGSTADISRVESPYHLGFIQIRDFRCIRKCY